MSELGEVLGAIGSLKTSVENLNEAVASQGEKIDAVTIGFAEVRANCVNHRAETDGLHQTLYGENGTQGLVKQIGVNTGRIDRLEESKRIVLSKLWMIATPLIIAAIIAVVSAGMAVWDRFRGLPQ